MAYMTYTATTGSYAYIGDDAAFDLTDDVEWRFDIAPADWTPEVVQHIIERWEAGPLSERSFRIYFGTSPTVQQIYLTLEDGAGGFRNTWTPLITSTTFSANQRVQLRLTVDANNGSSNTDIKLYSRTGGAITDLASNTGWTQEDDYTNVSGVQSWKASPHPIAIAGNNVDGASGFAGKFYRAVMWSDLTQTTKVFDIEFVDANSTSPWTTWDDAARTGNWTSANGTYTPDGTPLTLTPDGDGTIDTVKNELGTITNLYASVDEWPETATDWVTAGENDASGFFDLTATPTNFGLMATLKFEGYIRNTDFGADTCDLYAQVFKSDETTPLTTELLVGDETSDGLLQPAFTLNAAGLAATKTDWDAARVKLRWDYTP